MRVSVTQRTARRDKVRIGAVRPCTQVWRDLGGCCRRLYSGFIDIYIYTHGMYGVIWEVASGEDVRDEFFLVVFIFGWVWVGLCMTGKCRTRARVFSL